MAGNIKTNSVTLGDSATDSQNFQLRTNVDGTATLARGAAGNLGDVLTVDAAGTVALISPVKAVAGMSVSGATPEASGVTFPSTQVASDNANTLDDYREGSYTGTLTGGTTSPTDTLSYVRVGNMVTVNIPQPTTFTVSSNSTAMTITGGPIPMRPSTQRVCFARVRDNGVWLAGFVLIETNGTLSFYKDGALGVFTASGTKSVGGCSFSYLI